MQKVYEELTSAFRRNDGYLSAAAYERIVKKNSTFFDDFDTLFILLQASGYPIVEEGNRYRLETFFTPYGQQKYCVIDIETNGSKPETAQVIEVGAVMFQNGEVIGRFESFVSSTFLPEYISKITGILPEDLIDAPSQLEVLSKLRIFMEDAIFVAHDVKFDYNFTSLNMQKVGLERLLNRSLCSLALAERTIVAFKYSVSYLEKTFVLYVLYFNRLHPCLGVGRIYLL